MMEVEKNLLPSLGVSLVTSGRVPLLNKVNFHLRMKVLHALVAEQDRLVEEGLQSLNRLKSIMEEEFTSMITSQQSEVDMRSILANPKTAKLVTK